MDDVREDSHVESIGAQVDEVEITIEGLETIRQTGFLQPTERERIDVRPVHLGRTRLRIAIEDSVGKERARTAPDVEQANSTASEAKVGYGLLWNGMPPPGQRRGQKGPEPQRLRTVDRACGLAATH